MFVCLYCGVFCSIVGCGRQSMRGMWCGFWKSLLYFSFCLFRMWFLFSNLTFLRASLQNCFSYPLFVRLLMNSPIALSKLSS